MPKEIKTAEHRVAMTPDGVRELERSGIQVRVETGAGEGASISDAAFVAAGAEIVPTRRGRVGPGDGRQGEGAQGGGVRLSPRRPDAVHLPAPGRLSRGRQGARRRPHDRAGVRDRATRRRRPSAAGTDERGRRAAGPAAGRPLPRAAQGRPRRADGRGAGRAPGEGRRDRRRQRRLERGVDRRRHGGRGRAHRQEPRPPALGRPDPPRPDHDARLQPWGDRAQRHRLRPVDRRGARRRWAGAGGRQRRHGAGDEAAGRHRRRRRRSGRVHRDDPRDHPRRPGVRGARHRPLRRRQHARRGAAHQHVCADQRHPALHPRRRRAGRGGGGAARPGDRPRGEHRRAGE